MNKQIEEMAKSCPFLKNGKCQGASPVETDCDLMCKMFGFITNLIQEGYRKTEWISVEERFPERNGRYLTHCNIEGQSLVCILYYSKVGGFNEGAVTHWMPLPEDPKMKGEETNA